jgi:hypothetical protein
MRFLASLLLVFILVFLFWPYYHLYRLDNALGREDPTSLAPLVDLDAVRANTKKRLEWALGMNDTAPRQDPLGWFQQGLRHAGEVALEETMTLDWIHAQLRDAVATTTEKRPAYFLAAVDFAMFESWDSFIVRLGELGYNDTQLRLRLKGTTWKLTDVVR